MRGCILLLLASVGCSRSSEAEGRSAHEPTGAVSSPTQQKAEVTPELTRRAEQILKENEGAAIGAEIPFSMNGRRYVARIEEHENAEGDPGRPAGKHKGVTVYVAP
jgi:hypothetical protein